MPTINDLPETENDILEARLPGGNIVEVMTRSGGGFLLIDSATSKIDCLGDAELILARLEHLGAAIIQDEE